jgi:hypothetical protein
MLGVWLGPVVALAVLALTIPIVRFLQKKSVGLEAFSGASGPVGGEDPHEELLGEIRNIKAEIHTLHEAFSAIKLEIDALGTSLVEHRRIMAASVQHLEQLVVTQVPRPRNILLQDLWSTSYETDVRNVSGLSVAQYLIGSYKIRMGESVQLSILSNRPTPEDQLRDLVVPDTPAELFKERTRMVEQQEP